jgi:pyrroloquinoline quinone (PQQ) biosynthesis protein C
MSAHDWLLSETAAARAEFRAIPLLTRAIDGSVPRALYVAFLTQAYHHVRHTCPLLALAAAKTTDSDYRAALFDYMAEERGHEQWILSDISAMGGNPEAAVWMPPRAPCRAMVGYAYYAIDWISPYSLLGMIHVLEGASAALAAKAADALERAFGATAGAGFVYLKSHGALDVDHIEFFKTLVNKIENPAAGSVIIDAAKMMYWLYGNIFRDLEQNLANEAAVADR